jgi:hypothetical protein
VPTDSVDGGRRLAIGRWRFRIITGVTTVVVAGLVGISLSATPRPAASLLDRYAQTYAGLLGALGARDADPEVEGARAPAAPRVTLSFGEIEAQSQTALAALERTTVGPAPRRRHLIALFDALAARAGQLGGGTLTWSEELRRMFQATAPLPADTAMTKAREAAGRIDRMLPGIGVTADRLAAYEQQFLIPRDRLPVVFERALDECRRRTRAQVSFPHGDVVSVTYVQAAPWSGFSRYLGHGVSRIEVNLGLPLTVDRALELACHEGYPGHHALSTLRDAALPKEWPERDLAPAHSPDAYLGEATASWAADLVFSDEERLAFERDVLFPLADLDPSGAPRYLEVVGLTGQLRLPLGAAVSRYLAGDLDLVEAGWALKEEALMAYPLATLQFVNRYRGYALAYTAGRESLTPLLGRQLPEATRWTNYRWLATGGM